MAPAQNRADLSLPSRGVHARNHSARREAGQTLGLMLGLLALVAILAAGGVWLRSSGSKSPASETAARPATPDAARLSPEGQSRPGQASRSAAQTGEESVRFGALDDEFGASATAPAAALDSRKSADEPEAVGASSGGFGVGSVSSARSLTHSLDSTRTDLRDRETGSRASSGGALAAPPAIYQPGVDRVRADMAAAADTTPESLATPPPTAGKKTLSRAEVAERARRLLELRREGLRISGQLVDDGGDS